SITLVNRTPEKAMELADELGLGHAPFETLAEEIVAADIVLVATDAPQPTVSAAQLEGHGRKLIIDLSIPYNVDPAAKDIANVTLVNVDDLSRLKDETLSKREAEVPKAKAIIAAHLEEFTSWYEMRKHVPVLKAIKSTLKQIHNNPLFIPLYNIDTHTEEKIQRVINATAFKMKERNQKGCQYIEAINEFIATGTN
ncbi:MAG TPA: glutamyl-tRNA reductase, partial [Chitinophagaceae bacterium]